MNRLDARYFNSDPWRKRRTDWVNALPDGSFQRAEFQVVCETLAMEQLEPRCVVNIGADALLKFFRDGRYFNTYELENSVGKGGRPFPMMGEKPPRVSKTRQHVDELIGYPGDSAAKLYFAAVALSGAGIRFYGEYCMVMALTPVEKRNPNVLDRNSYDLVHEPLAQRVAGGPEAGDAKIEVDWLRAKWSDGLSDLLAMKVAPTIDSPHRLVTPGAVAEGVLADEDFVEVHLEGTFSVADLDEIRFAPEEEALASDVVNRIERGAPPDVAEWLWVWRRGLVDVACSEQRVRRRVTTAAGRTRRWQ